MGGTATSTTSVSFGLGWLALCGALILHVIDEATTGFLTVYNPTVLALRQRYVWFPMPTFRFEEWLTGLAIVNVVLLALSPFAFRGARPLRPCAYLFAFLMIVNGTGHTLGTIFGQTVSSVHFSRPMPGFYSSPALLAASAFLLVQLKRSAPKAERRT